MTTHVPITLLTGFLGSGKTTLCNALVRHPSMRDALVLVNEAGEVSVDHHLVEEIDERVVVLPSGCVCCALRDDLVEVLDNPAVTAGRSHVLIETSGLADPTPLVATVLRHPRLSARFFVANVVVALDPTRAPDLLERFPEAAKQLALADRVIITKCDLASEAQIEQAERVCARMCPEASVSRGLPEADGDEAGWLTRPVRARAIPEETHDHTHGIRTFTVESTAPTHFRQLAAWLSMMTQFNGDRLLRLKGLVHVDDHDGPVVIQTVQHVVYPTYTLPAWPEGEPRTRLVGITQAMSGSLFTDVVDSLGEIVRAS